MDNSIQENSGLGKIQPIENSVHGKFRPWGTQAQEIELMEK